MKFQKKKLIKTWGVLADAGYWTINQYAKYNWNRQQINDLDMTKLI